MPRSGNRTGDRYKSGRPTTEAGITAALRTLEKAVERLERKPDAVAARLLQIRIAILLKRVANLVEE